MNKCELLAEIEALYDERAILNKDVARLCGITSATLSRMINGKAAISVVVENMVFLLRRVDDKLFAVLCDKRGVHPARNALREQVMKNRKPEQNPVRMY